MSIPFCIPSEKMLALCQGRRWEGLAVLEKCTEFWRCQELALCQRGFLVDLDVGMQKELLLQDPPPPTRCSNYLNFSVFFGFDQRTEDKV